MSNASSAVRPTFLAAAFLTAITLAACSSDKIVYRDRQPFNQPVAAAAGFLGYYDTVTKQTTCGNCHADHQAPWSQTKHAKAWSNLQASAGKAASCEGCHSVTGNGNAAVGTPVGYTGVKSAVYTDVQCESCHGAGLTHIEGVGQGNITVRPLASINMVSTGNCGDCHSGAHQPFAEEWKSSGHGDAPTHNSSTCIGCHEGRGALARFGVTGNFKEKADPNNFQSITCAVCHNPHGSSNPAQLRFSISSPDPEQNLCMQCHLRRAVADATSNSPHAPQGGVLLGFAGYRPPGFQYDTARIFGSHATDKNPRLCAGCHVTRFQVTDKLTGAFAFQATGHLMRPIPCLDAAGKPTGDKTCAYTTTARSWQSCTQSGCHANAGVAAGAFNTIRGRMKFYVDQLWINTNANSSIDAAPTDGGLLATLKATKPNEWKAGDGVLSPAEGAEYNARLCGEIGQANSDNSKGIHNPFLCEALLTATISYIKSYYGFPAASRSEQVQLNGPIGGEFHNSMHVSRTTPR